MPRFFIEQPLVQGQTAAITGDDAHHIVRALRMRPGEAVTLCGPEGLPHEGVLLSLHSASVAVQIGSPLPETGEPSVALTLLVGMPKQDKLTLVIQKAVELGAAAIIPFAAARSIVRLEGEGADKLPRWQKIAREAAMQCGRGKVPVVGPLVPYERALSLALQADVPLLCYEGGGTAPLSSVLQAAAPFSSVSALIGPEGGFSLEEVASAKAAGLSPVSLGSRILRCETAPLCLLSAVLYAAGEL